MDLLNMKDITVSYGKNALPSVENQPGYERGANRQHRRRERKRQDNGYTVGFGTAAWKRQSGTRRHFVSGEFAAEPE